MHSTRRYGTLLAALLGLLVGGPGCGDYNLRDGAFVGYSYCRDINGSYRFRALVPPWEHFKEYRCSAWLGTSCTGTWSPTGRYVYVVSDVPFVNYDSEIVTSLEVEQTTGNTASLANQFIANEGIGASGSVATFWGDPATYPRAIEVEQAGVSGHEILWRQERTFEGSVFNWHRRDVWLSAGAVVYHLKFFSIETLDRPEFDSLISSFEAAPWGDDSDADYANCNCRDEHDPAGPRDC